MPCSGHFSPSEFFKDSPWLNIPTHRLGEILIEPLYPRFGLLGGSPSTTQGKVSKLAALAAARKRKESEKATDVPSTQQSSSVALLDKLNRKAKTEVTDEPPRSAASAAVTEKFQAKNEDEVLRRTRKYPVRKKDSPSPPAEILEEISEPVESDVQQIQKSSTLKDTPSRFATTMLGDRRMNPGPEGLKTAFELPYAVDPNFTEIEAFTGPSPDDIVTNAQAKGATFRAY